jgi:hypothetical protein
MCCRTAFQLLRLMADDRSLADRTLADVLVLLRCQHCQQRPTSTALVDDAAGHASGRTGSSPGWRVMLIGNGRT